MAGTGTQSCTPARKKRRGNNSALPAHLGAATEHVDCGGAFGVSRPGYCIRISLEPRQAADFGPQRVHGSAARGKSRTLQSRRVTLVLERQGCIQCASTST